MCRTTAAALCGLSSRQFDDAIRPGLDSKDTRGSGRNLRLHGPAVVAALLEYRLGQAKPDAPAPIEGDPLLTGPESPALEHYRELKVELLKRDLAERDGELVKSSTIRSALRPAIAAMRGTGDRLVREFGNKAAEIFNEGIEEFALAALKVIEQQGGDEDPDDG